MESLSNRYSSTVTIIATPETAGRTGTKKHSLSTLKIVPFILRSQFRRPLPSNNPNRKIRWNLDFTSQATTKYPEAQRPDSTGPIGPRRGRTVSYENPLDGSRVRPIPSTRHTAETR